MHYLATFYTHLSAIQTDCALKARGVNSQMAPVPRAVSSSCGTCVRYEAESDCLDALDEDVEALYCEQPAGNYRLLMKNE